MIDVDSLPSDPAEVRVWLRQQEVKLSLLVRASLRKIVQASVDRYVGSLVAAGDPGAFDSIPGAWLTVVQDSIAPHVEDLYLAGQVNAWVGLPTQPTEAMARSFEAVTNQNAVSYMEGATNRLAGVGQTTWQMVQDKTTAAIAEGMSTEDLKTAIEKVTGLSEFRADTIARTETNAAYRQGDRAGQLALGSSGPVERVWRATFDNRTREDHADADGQCIGMNDQYEVGGELLDAPMDPSGSPENVVNCRCYEEYLYPGDERPDGTVIEAATEEDDQSFDVPDHPTIDDNPEPTTVAAEMGTPRTPRYANVDAAAEKFGVSRAQVANYLQDGPAVANAIKNEAAQTAADAFHHLDSFEGLKLARPIKGAGGEYDFLERLSPQERNRLSSGGWWSDNRDSHAIDVVFDQAVRVGAISADASIDDFTAHWLEQTRTIDASRSLRAGRWPDTARFGGFDPATLAPAHAEQGLDISKVIGKDRWDQAGYLAERATADASEQAYRALGADRLTGEAPWRMSFDTWRGEVGDLEHEIANGADVAANTARLQELAPFDLDRGQDYESLYAEVIETAKVAGVDVASWASIPWAQ